MKRKLFLISIILVMVLGCSTKKTEEPVLSNEKPKEIEKEKPKEKPVQKEILLSLEELAKYDGQNNNAYIVVDGVIYDVTNAKNYQNGEYYGHKVGQDLSAALKKLPDVKEVLESLVVVGRLAK